MRVLGLDLSYTSTGVVVLGSEEGEEGEEGEDKVLLAYAVPAGAPRATFHTRMTSLWAGLEPALALNPDIVVIEGAAYDKVFKVFDLGQLNGVVKYKLVEAGFKYIEIPPTSARKLVVDNGAAKKEEVAAIIASKFGYKNNVLDIIDAFVIAKAYILGYLPKVKPVKKFKRTKLKYVKGGNNLIV